MHMHHFCRTFSGAYVVNMYKCSAPNVYISSAIQTLRILPTAMQRASSKA